MGIQNIVRKTFAAAFLAATVDGVAAEGHYGGAALDSMGFNQTANTYRLVGQLGHGLGQFVWWAVTDTAEDVRDLANKHGQPRP